MAVSHRPSSSIRARHSLTLDSKPSPSYARWRNFGRLPQYPASYCCDPGHSHQRRVQRSRLRVVEAKSIPSKSASEPTIRTNWSRKRNGGPAQGSASTVGLLSHFRSNQATRGETNPSPDSIIIDAAMRRHNAQKAFLRATAALRWINSRAAILQGHRTQAIHEPALQQIRNALQVVCVSYSVVCPSRSPLIVARNYHE